MNATREHYLAELEMFFADGQVCRDCPRLLAHFSIRLAALGRAAEVLAIVERSPEQELFVSLADGLRLYLGWPVSESTEEAGAFAEKIQRAVTDFAFDQDALARELEVMPGEYAADATSGAAESVASIDYGFIRAAAPAA
ncbi:MAG TPA: hypothetical protein VFB27_06175 [Opitutaceae bacterium]|nr:hypothetical protein [Opitutaceae bacterium]